MDEQEAIKRLKNSDEKAFSFLYKSYWPKVNHFTRLYIIDTDSAEEIIQEVFIKLWEHRKELNESGSLDGYLFIITRNLIFNSSRQSFNHQFYQTTIIEAMEQSYNIDEELDAADLHAYINSIIEQLLPRQQEVFRLSREHQLTYQEIAQKLQISIKTVERHMGEALKFLRKNLRLYAIFLMLMD